MCTSWGAVIPGIVGGGGVVTIVIGPTVCLMKGCSRMRAVMMSRRRRLLRWRTGRKRCGSGSVSHRRRQARTQISGLINCSRPHPHPRTPCWTTLTPQTQAAATLLRIRRLLKPIFFITFPNLFFYFLLLLSYFFFSNICLQQLVFYLVIFCNIFPLICSYLKKFFIKSLNFRIF